MARFFISNQQEARRASAGLNDMAARKGRPADNPVVRMTDEHRAKIAKSNILNALIEHVQGDREMSATQVTAGLGLLRKCLPDLSNIEMKGAGENGEFVMRFRFE